MSSRTLLMTMLLLMPVLPMVSAGTDCVPTAAAVGCVTVEPVSEEGCESEPGGSECYTAEGDRVGASLDTVVGEAALEAEQARTTDTFHTEMGACTSLDMSVEGEHIAAVASADALVVSGTTAVAARWGNGTLVYEDPCGENLIPELEPGTYQVRYLFAGGLLALGLPVGFLVAHVTGQEFNVQDDDGSSAYCQRELHGFVILVGPGGPPMILDPGTGNTC